MIPLRIASICVLVFALSGCPSAGRGGGGGTTGELDTSGVTTARFGDEYLGQLRVVNYTGAARFTVNGGGFPQGLDMDEAGRIQGTAEYVETTTAEVLVTGMDGIDDFVGGVSLGVTAQYVENAFLGYEHDQLNNMLDHPSREYMANIWVRLSGVGIDDMSEWTMNPGIYLAGPNGAVEDGRGDDERIGDLAFSELEWTLEDWEATVEENTYPDQGYPDPHLPEGDAPTVSDDGIFAAGVDGGEARFTAEHPDFANTITKRLQVVPPDWCPNGEHDGGNSDGQCS